MAVEVRGKVEVVRRCAVGWGGMQSEAWSIESCGGVYVGRG